MCSDDDLEKSQARYNYRSTFMCGASTVTETIMKK
jgi:hypothetical protein